MGGGTCASICVVQGGLERLRHDLFGTDGHVVTTKRAIERNAALCKSLQVLVEQAHESCEHLRVGQAKTNTNLQITKDDLTSKSEVLKKVGADVDKLLGVKHPDIDGKLVEVYQRIGNLDDFQTNLKKDIALTQAEVQQLHGHAEEADACLKEMRRSLSHHGQSLTKVSEKMDEMQENLEMTNGVVMQLHKSHEDEHGQTMSALRVTKQDLGRLSAGHDTTVKLLDQAREQVQELLERCSITNGTVQAISRGLEKVNILAN